MTHPEASTPEVLPTPGGCPTPDAPPVEQPTPLDIFSELTAASESVTAHDAMALGKIAALYPGRARRICADPEDYMLNTDRTIRQLPSEAQMRYLTAIRRALAANIHVKALLLHSQVVAEDLFRSPTFGPYRTAWMARPNDPDVHRTFLAAGLVRAAMFPQSETAHIISRVLGEQAQS